MRDVSTGVVVEEIFADESIAGGAGSLLAPEWLVLQPGANVLPNPTFLTDLSGWTQTAVTAGVTVVGSRDIVYSSDAPGSLRFEITPNTAPGAATITWASPTTPPYPAVSAGQPYVLIGSTRTNIADWLPRLQINWYDVNGVFLSSDIEPVYTPTLHTFVRRAFQVVAPAEAASATVSATATTTVGGATGTVHFDDLWFGGSMLTVDANSFVSFDLSASGTEGYYG
jgi:hypothetical protein